MDQMPDAFKSASLAKREIELKELAADIFHLLEFPRLADDLLIGAMAIADCVYGSPNKQERSFTCGRTAIRHCHLSRTVRRLRRDEARSRLPCGVASARPLPRRTRRLLYGSTSCWRKFFF